MHLRDGGNGFHVVIGRPCPALTFRPRLVAKVAALAYAPTLAPVRRQFWHQHSNRWDLDKRCANLCRSFDLLFIGAINRETWIPASARRLQASRIFHAALRRPGRLRLLLPDAFPYQTAKMWLRLNGDRQHLFGPAISRFMRVSSVWRRMHTSRR